MNKFKFILFVLLAINLSAYAQSNKVAIALTHFQNENYSEAKLAIDDAANDEISSLDPYTWYVHGFIYKEIYKASQKSNPISNLRLESLESFKKSISLDKANEHKEDNEQNLKYLATTFFNDVVLTLNPKDYQIAIKNFESFKEIQNMLGQHQSLKSMEIEFKLALASVFTSIYDSERVANIAYFKKVEDLYANVLQIDPENISANYNLGILYYNKAVNIINELDFDMDIFEFMEVQESTVSIFKQSLPFMEKAYKLDPQKKETLKGLEGIYFSLHEIEKSNEIKARLEKLD
ncbi:MAG: hypothetical protein H0V01_15340 [Bacteroidetes bacterium]|nr:hypothetical protein [Bacteroidota bacterium]HET6244415.1 hypothetical protein [Bacteroidia bacterium]